MPDPPGHFAPPGADDATTHIGVPAIFDHHAAGLLRIRVDRALTESPAVLVMNCSGVRFADSGGLRLLLEATRAGQDYGIRVLTYDPDGALDHLLGLVDVGQELTIVTEAPAESVDLRGSSLDDEPR